MIKKTILMLLVLVGGVMSANAQITESGKIKVYFQNNNNWETVKLYVKGNDQNSTEIKSWPGTDITNNTVEVDGNTYHYYVVDMSKLNGADAITVNINNGSNEQSYDWDKIKYDVFFTIATTSSETVDGWTKYNLSRETKYYLYDTSSLSIKLDLVSGNVYGAIVDNSIGNSMKYYVVADTEDGGAFNWGNGFDWSKNKWRPWGDDQYKNLGWNTIELSNSNCWKGTTDGDSWCFAPGLKYYFTINPIDADQANYKFGVEPYFERTIPANSYATFSSEYDVAIPDGVTAYYATGATVGKVTMTPIANGIPSTQAAMLYKEDGGLVTFTPAVTLEESTTNLLVKGTIDGVPATTTDKFRYVFGTQNDVLAFYNVATAISQVMTGKAYLETTESIKPASGAPILVTFGDDATDIRSIGNIVKDNVYYDLSGRRVAEPTKGVYIVNGKKVIIK